MGSILPITLTLAVMTPAVSIPAENPAAITREGIRRAVAAETVSEPANMSAHNGSGDWAAVKQLCAGADVRVAVDDAPSQRGAVVGADDEALTLAASGSNVRIVRERIKRVSLVVGKTRARNAGIGLLVGAAVGVPFLLSYCGRHHLGSSCGEAGGAFFWPFGGAGALFGALSPPSPKWQEIYRRN